MSFRHAFFIFLTATFACPVAALAVDLTIINQNGRSTILPRAPLPQEELQGSREEKARQRKQYEAAEEELIKAHTPEPAPALTREEIEAIIDEKMGKKPKEPEAPKEEVNPNFGKIGGIGTVGGIGGVGGIGEIGNLNAPDKK